MTTLLMFSGGIESTAGLVHLLTETSKDIHVHHIVIKEVLAKQADKYFDVSSTPSIGHGESWKGGLDAVTKIIPYCRKNYRSFKFTSNLMDFAAVQSKFMSNYPPRAWMCNYIINQYPNIDTLIHTVSAIDSLPGFSTDELIVGPRIKYSFWGDVETRKDYYDRQIFMEKVSTFEIKRDIKISSIFGPLALDYINLDRKTMVKKYIPFELFKETWSCNFPASGPIECGKCLSCIHKIETGIEAYGESPIKLSIIPKMSYQHHSPIV